MLGLVVALEPVRTSTLSVTLTIRVYGKNGELICYFFGSRPAEALLAPLPEARPTESRPFKSNSSTFRARLGIGRLRR